MVSALTEKAKLLALAEHLVRLGSALPRIDTVSGESIEEFVQRRRNMERLLIERLRELPGCEVVLARNGTDVGFSLAGLRASSRGRLAGAFTAWIAEAKQRARETDGGQAA